jgi:hypothetical protein
MNTPLRWFVFGALAWSVPAGAAAQQTAAEKLRVFLDCNYCDMDFMRTEITWIDYMRDRADAHVHVLVTRQQTGGGGGEYTLEFIGLREFVGRTDTLKYVSTVDDTQDLIRRGLARTVKIGLVPFVAQTPQAKSLEITMPAAATTPATPQRDPWNFWSFTIGMNGETFGESSQNFGSFRGNLTANRTTAAWKINTNVNGRYSENTFEYTIADSLYKTVSITRSYNLSTLIVKSLGPHLSVGGRVGASTSTFGNTSLTFSFTPAVEYNFFPYDQSTRRALTVQYGAGTRYADYRELTIFGEEEETRPIHTLALDYSTRQPWGSVNVGLDGSQYLHDRSKYNVGVSGNTNLRLFRGFSFNVSGGYTRVRDQLHIVGRDLTEEEILLRQRQVATAYNYFVFFGINYRFGSIFNSVVNPRLTTTSGEFIVF